MSGSIGKEMFLRAHDRLVNEYLDAHPSADLARAHESVSWQEAHDLAYDDAAAAAEDEADRRRDEAMIAQLERS